MVEMDYISQKIVISVIVDATVYADCRYELYTNGGAGDVDYENPVTRKAPMITPQTSVSGGNATVKTEYLIDTPGLWKFAIKAYDDIGKGNENIGTLEEKSKLIDLVPQQASKPTVTNYSNNTLTLEIN